jgi:ubiquinone/menaquinone biosynthesis C-methylase UbiE
VQTADKLFTGSIPETYDRFLVPLIFEVYALDLTRRVATRTPQDVLETAAGTGVLTRALAAKLPPQTRIVASDLNQSMLDRAAARQRTETRVSWQQADALALPFDAAAFDVVVCQFGVMFFPDKVQGYKEARRVLRPGGRFLFNVWDRISQNAFAHVVTDALAKLFPNDPPSFLARTPHGYCDVRKIRDDLMAAGFAAVAVEMVDGTSSAPSPRDAAVAYCRGTPLRNEIEARHPTGLEEATQAAEAALAQRFGHGPIEAPIRAHVITADP